MSHVIRLLALAGLEGVLPTPHDGRFVVVFEPAPMDARGHSGGKLITTDDIDQAKRFTDAGEALMYWSQQNGLRPDGEPNKPLTAWSAEIADECVYRQNTGVGRVQ